MSEGPMSAVRLIAREIRLPLYVGIALLLLGCAHQGEPVEDVDPPDVVRDVFERSVVVEALDGHGRVISWGSGTKVHLLFVATAAHVVEGAREIRYWTYSYDIRTGRGGYVSIAADLVACDREVDIAILRIRNGEADLEKAWTPLASEALRPGEIVYVHDFAPGTEGRVWRGRALTSSTLNVSGRPGSSGAGVYVLRHDRFELATIVVARTEIPVRRDEYVFHQGTSIVRVVAVDGGARVTHVADAGILHRLTRRVR